MQNAPEPSVLLGLGMAFAQFFITLGPLKIVLLHARHELGTL